MRRDFNSSSSSHFQTNHRRCFLLVSLLLMVSSVEMKREASTSRWYPFAARKHHQIPEEVAKTCDALEHQPQHSSKPLIRSQSLLSGSFPLSPVSTCTSISSLTLSRSSSSASSTVPEVETSSSVIHDACTSKQSIIRPTKEPSLFSLEVEHKGVQKILDALTDEEKRQLPDENMPLRHFRAEKGDVDKAIQKLRSTLKWRKEFGVEDIISCFNNDEVYNFYEEDNKRQELQGILREENRTGKVYVRGYDKNGRAIIYLRPACENTNSIENNMKHLVYNLERAIACTARRTNGMLEKVNIVIDYHGFTLRNAPPMKSSLYTLDILQAHYCERMYRAYICEPPGVFRVFWKMVKPFIDPRTKEKIVFCHGNEGRGIVENNFELARVEECAWGTIPRESFRSQEYLEGTPFCKAFAEC